MKKPTVTQAYAMIRLLKKRAQPGDGEKIQQLEAEIQEARDRLAQLDLDKYFADDPLVAAKPKK